MKYGFVPEQHWYGDAPHPYPFEYFRLVEEQRVDMGVVRHSVVAVLGSIAVCYIVLRFF